LHAADTTRDAVDKLVEAMAGFDGAPAGQTHWRNTAQNAGHYLIAVDQ